MEAGRFDLALFAHRATGRALRLAHGPVRSSNQNSEAAAAFQRPKPGLQCVRALSVEARTSHGTEFLLQDIKFKLQQKPEGRRRGARTNQYLGSC